MRFFLFFLFFPSYISAQVVNDDIHQAKVLEIGSTASSSTVHSTIQPECVNYALTKTCLKYHNDQWFIFNSGKFEKLYINVSDQECRDLLGVQLVVIEGEPCDIKHYDLIECISFSSNDDFYVKVDSLQLYTDYLLNIDGYLHDFCSFEIVVDTVPQGMPNEINLKLENNSKQDSSRVQLSWLLPDSIENEILHFEIWRRHEKNYKHELRQKISVRRNAYGSVDNQYSFADTIAEHARFYYRLLAVDKEGKKLLFDERQFQGIAPVLLDALRIRLRYPLGTPLSITISDKKTGEIFRKVRFSFNPQNHELLEYPVSYLIEKGVKVVLVEVLSEKTGEVFKQEYSLK